MQANLDILSFASDFEFNNVMSIPEFQIDEESEHSVDMEAALEFEFEPIDDQNGLGLCDFSIDCRSSYAQENSCVRQVSDAQNTQDDSEFLDIIEDDSSSSSTEGSLRASVLIHHYNFKSHSSKLD